MFGVILTTIHKSCGITSQKVEGFKTREAVEIFVKDWEKPFHPEWSQYNDCHTEKPYSTHYTIYEVPDSVSSQTPNLGGLDVGQIASKVSDLCVRVNSCHDMISEDATAPNYLVEQISVAKHVVDELYDTFSEITNGTDKES